MHHVLRRYVSGLPVVFANCDTVRVIIVDYHSYIDGLQPIAYFFWGVGENGHSRRNTFCPHECQKNRE
jgi:hypothetical protein